MSKAQEKENIKNKFDAYGDDNYNSGEPVIPSATQSPVDSENEE